MVMALFLPKPIEEQCVTRIKEGYDNGIIRGMLQPRHGSKFCVAVCQDGRGRADRAQVRE